jgi:DNA-binding transcriptional ArsR family regulator
MTSVEREKTNRESGAVRMVHRGRVARAREQAVPERELERLALTYKLLGDPTRLKIVLGLAGGEMCVCDLAAYLGLSESAVSHQLRKLRDLALVKRRRRGQVLYYALDDEHVTELLELGIVHVRET